MYNLIGMNADDNTRATSAGANELARASLKAHSGNKRAAKEAIQLLKRFR
jgi:hypothetical protein